MKILAALVLLIGRVASAAGIENAICEQTGPTAYHLEFRAPSDAGAIAVYASVRADRIDSNKPLLTTPTSPMDITVPPIPGRVYFHLVPQSGPERVVSIRHLPIEGATNFRDLGGYTTKDGHHVRWGLVYRSSNLAMLTAKDYEYLGSLGIRLVCDFRVDSERERSPTKWQATNPPEIVTESIDTLRYIAPPIVRADGFPNIYRNMPVDALAQFGDVLHRLAKADYPTLVHCTAGKDRTGVFSALLLTALGVPPEVVKADYLLTNQYVPSGVQADWLDLAFNAVAAKYGTFDKYLRDGLGVSDSELTALRNRLLEP